MLMPQNNPEGYDKTSVAEGRQGPARRAAAAARRRSTTTCTRRTRCSSPTSCRRRASRSGLMLYEKSRHGVVDPLLVKHMRQTMLDFTIETLSGRVQRPARATPRRGAAVASIRAPGARSTRAAQLVVAAPGRRRRPPAPAHAQAAPRHRRHRCRCASSPSFETLVTASAPAPCRSSPRAGRRARCHVARWPGRTTPTSGSGVILDAAGYVMTNYHVVQGRGACRSCWPVAARASRSSCHGARRSRPPWPAWTRTPTWRC